MSRVFLTIGHQRMILPSDKGLATLLSVLKDAVQVEDDRSYLSTDPTIQVGDEIEVEVKILGKKIKFTTETPDGDVVPVDEPSPKRRTAAASKPSAKQLTGRETPKQLRGQTQLLLGGPGR